MATAGRLKRKYEEEDEESERATVFPCKICSTKFVTKLSLSRHMILHEDDQPVAEQKPADISSATERVMSNFLETILKAEVPRLQNTTPMKSNGRPVPNLKPLPPLIPKKEFEMAQMMKQFKCQMCNVYFGKKEDLSRHVTRTHGGARFTCPYCNRNISRRDHLKRHIKNVHPEYCTDTEIGPFLADPNASRAAKEQHAENFVAQYVSGEAKDNNPLGMEAGANTDMLLSLAQDDQFNDVDLEEEGDDEFEGEEDFNSLSATANEMQQITIEPDLPPNEEEEDNYNGETGDTFDYMDQSLHLDGFQQMLQNNSLIMDMPPAVEGTTTLPERKFKCEMCDAAFMNKINLHRHLTTHSIVRPHKCNICGKGFLRKEHLTKHLSSVHSGLKYTCQFCGKDISRKDHLLRHIRNCHPVEFTGMPPDMIDSEPQPIVNLLPFQGQVASKLDNSFNQNSKLKLALLCCDLCSETFNHIDELHEHQSSVHSDVRKFKCPHCPKAFKRKEHLVKHQATHVTTSVQNNFSCTTCDKTFSKMEAVYDHIRRVHGGPVQESTNLFQCNLCEQTFQHRLLLTQHLQTYHGVSHSDNLFQNVQETQFTNSRVFNNSYKSQQSSNFSYKSPQNANNFHKSVTNNFKSPVKKRPTSVKAKLNSLGIDVPADGSLGNLMGLINRGSLSLSRVMSSK